MKMNNLGLLVTKKFNEICKNLDLKENSKIIRLNIEYFYDGESLDLGIKIFIYDKKTEKIQDKYISFILDEYYFEKKIDDYFSNLNENVKFTELRLLAENIKSCMNKNLYCFEDIEEIIVQCYD